MTAPSVPPNTIRAGVGWTIWAIFPPSINNPARIPPTARNMPAIVLLSTSVSFRMREHISIRLRTGGRHRSVRIGHAKQATDYGALELDDPRHHLSLGLLDQDFISAQQSDHRIGVALDEFDKVGVHGDLLAT